MKHAQHNLDTLEQERAAKVRFKQQIFASVGGGMIFALVGVVTAKLLSMGAATGAATAATEGAAVTTAAAAGTAVLPILGIAAVGLIGLGCVYLAAKYLSKAVSLDQETQAEKISQATLGRGPAIVQAPTMQPTKPVNVPIGGALGVQGDDRSAATQQDTPGTMVSDLAYQQKMAASHGEKITFH